MFSAHAVISMGGGDKSPVIEARAAALGEFGKFLLRKLPSQFLRKADEIEFHGKIELMKENSDALTNWEKLSLSLLFCDVPSDPPKLNNEEFFSIADRFLKSLSLKLSESGKIYFEDEFNENDLNYYEHVFEKEARWVTEWREAFRSGFYDFDKNIIRNFDYEDYNYGGKSHSWHERCYCDSIQLPEEMQEVCCEPKTKEELFEALICANFCKQIANIWDSVEPVSDQVWEYSTGRGSWSEMVEPGAAYYGRSLVSRLNAEQDRWIEQLVLCERCKQPGCIGITVCSNSLAFKANNENGDFTGFGAVFDSIVEIDSTHREVFHGKLSLFLPNTTLDMNPIAAFGFLASNYLGKREAYEIALRAYHDPEGARLLTNFLNISGLHYSIIGAFFCNLDKLSVSGNRNNLEKIKHQQQYQHGINDFFKLDAIKLREIVKNLLDKELPIFHNASSNNCASLLELVQNNWKNVKIILKSEKYGEIFDILNRIKLAKSLNDFYISINVLSDLEIFPFDQRKLVIEELCGHLNCKVGEFPSNQVDCTNELVLSILISAYIEYACPDTPFFCFERRILWITNDVNSAVRSIENIRGIGLNIEANCSAEDGFVFDYAFSDKYCRGGDLISIINSLCSISGATIADRIRKYAEASWSLVNRSGSKGSAECFSLLMQKSTGLPKEVCLKILRGEIGVEGGPVRDGPSVQTEVECIYFDFKLSGNLDVSGTIEGYEAPEIEIEALKALGITLNCGKGNSFSISDFKPIIKIVELGPEAITDTDIWTCLEKVSSFGCLSNFKHLYSIKDQIPFSKLAELIKITGSICEDPKNAYQVAWGSECNPVVVVDGGSLDYNQCKNLLKRVSPSIGKISVTYSVFL